MEETATPLVPGVHPRKHGLRTLGLLLAIVIVVLALIAGAMWMNPGLFFGVWSARSLPKELSDTTLLSSRGSQIDIYTPNGWRYEHSSYANGVLGSFISAPNGSLIVRSLNPSTYEIDENGAKREQATVPLAAPDKAPYAGLIAYAALNDTDAPTVQGIPSQLSPINPSTWEIRLYSLTSGSSARVISGYAPLFFDDTHFFFVNAGGIYLYDLTAGTATHVLERSFPFVLGPILQSPDRTLIAFRDPVTKTTAVYRMDSSVLVLVKEIPGILAAPALSNDALYNLVRSKQGTEVWKYDWMSAEPTHLYTFPSDLAVGRMVF